MTFIFSPLRISAYILVAASIFGCKPTSDKLVTLEITSANSYIFLSTPVSSSELAHEFKAIQSNPVQKVRLRIFADPMAKIQTVSFAVRTAKENGIDQIEFKTVRP
jgi:biopolymer transport protein ExbD